MRVRWSYKVSFGCVVVILTLVHYYSRAGGGTRTATDVSPVSGEVEWTDEDAHKTAVRYEKMKKWLAHREGRHSQEGVRPDAGGHRVDGDDHSYVVEAMHGLEERGQAGVRWGRDPDVHAWNKLANIAGDEVPINSKDYFTHPRRSTVSPRAGRWSRDVSRLSSQHRRAEETRSLWDLTDAVMSPSHLYPTRSTDTWNETTLYSVLDHLASVPVIRAYLMSPTDGDLTRERGPQTDYGSTHKWLLALEGGRSAVFKPMWYNKEYQPENWYEGFELPTSEVASFHLDKVLQLNKVPYTTWRQLDIERDILPVASAQLRKHIGRTGGEWCVTDRCYLCTSAVRACSRGGVLAGAVSLLLPHLSPPQPHPWDISHYHRERDFGVHNRSRCHVLSHVHAVSPAHLHDLVDLAVLDHLSYNFDSKVYHVTGGLGKGLMIHLDRGRSFTRYDRDDDANILVLKQCCVIRPSTLRRLLNLKTERVSRLMSTSLLRHHPEMPLLLPGPAHLRAMDKRLAGLLHVIQGCNLISRL